MLLLDEDGWYVEGYVWIDDNQPRVQLSIFYTVGDRDGPRCPQSVLINGVHYKPAEENEE